VPSLRKRLIVVGDRILVRPEKGEERTNTGLYLPQTAISSRLAQGGWVAAVGPGLPIAEPVDLYEETGHDPQPVARYVPLQAQEGDYVLFLRKAAVEITFERQQYLIVPNSAILVLVREDWDDSDRRHEAVEERGASDEERARGADDADRSDES
jgi:chaperonin GroES